MDTTWKTALRQQFGASLDMLESSLRACPDDLWQIRMWGERSGRPELAEFWYVAYHTLFWLDLYLTGSVEGFAPPVPFTLSELDPAGLLPERVYTRDELLTYLEYSRRKCQVTIAALTDEQARRHCRFSWGEVSFAGLLLDNMRHVQEHAAQLNMFLGQKIGSEPGWVAQEKND
jgi:hypothetical protein